MALKKAARPEPPEPLPGLRGPLTETVSRIEATMAWGELLLGTAPEEDLDDIERFREEHKRWVQMGCDLLQSLFTTTEPKNRFCDAATVDRLGSVDEGRERNLRSMRTKIRKAIPRGLRTLADMVDRCREGTYAVQAETPASEPIVRAPTLDLFVSHADEDTEDIVKPLVEFLRHALRIERERVRCTSIPEYAHPLGDKTAETLRQEVTTARYVLGLISERSVESSWVLFELGARWGANAGNLIALVVPGARMKILPDPLKDPMAGRVDDAPRLRKLVTEMARGLGKELDPQDYEEKLDALARKMQNLARRERARSTPADSEDG